MNKNNDLEPSHAAATAAFVAAFATGLAVAVWVGVGYGSSHLMALAITVAIAGFYLLGARELHRYRQDTRALSGALQAFPANADAAALQGWLATLPVSLRNAVRQRIEGGRSGLPAPVLASYLTGLLVLGMVGTFLGMVVTLDGTGAALAGADGLGAIRDALSAPVRGLGLAFGTSVAGVAASAMLGLMAALARRERLQAGQQLDALLPTALRPFTPLHQREASLRLLEQQAGLLPALVDRITDAMAAMERGQAALAERLQADQARFYQETEAAYTGLAAAVERTLTASTAESARLAGAALQPAVEATLAGLGRESAQLQTALADQVRRQLDGMAGQFTAATTAVTTQWTGALAEHRRTSDATAQALRGTLDGFTQSFEQRSTALADGLTERLVHQSDALSARWGEALAQQAESGAQLAVLHEQALQAAADQWVRHADVLHTTVQDSHTRLQADLAESDAARQQAWDASLRTLSGALHQDWQTAQAGATTQWRDLGQLLSTTAESITARNADQATHLLAQIEHRAAQDEARQAAWTQSLQSVAETLRAEWQAAQAQSTGQWHQLGDVLAATADGISQRSADQATQLLAQIEHRAAQDEARQTAWTQSLQSVAESLRAEWQAAQVQSTGQWHQLGDVLAATADGISQRSADQAAQLLTQIEHRAAQDEARQAAWTQSLQSVAESLRAEWQAAQVQSTGQWHQLGEVLAATAEGVATRAAEQATQALSHIDQRAAQDEARQAAWAQSLQALSTTLRTEWQEAGALTAARWDEASAALARSTGEITQALDTHAQRTLGEIGTLVQTASEAPRAAAEVIGELRQKLADSMVRDNAMLEERSRILQTLSRLLDAVGEASAQQRGAIDTLLDGTTGALERAGTRFADTLQAQTDRMDGVAAQLTGSAVEVASLGEAFGAAVQHFGHANEQLVAQLQRIEAALSKSLVRSDEQLDYYVAQAREVIELSVGAQKQVMDGLQQVVAARAHRLRPNLPGPDAMLGHEELEAGTSLDADVPVWAVFGDLMAGALGAFALILVAALGMQMDLSERLKIEQRQREAQTQRLQTLEQALAGPLAGGRVTLVDGRIGISGNVLFALNSDELQPEGQQLLRSLAGPLTSYLGSRSEILMVSGFTDDQRMRGGNRFADNWELSAQRALTVTRALIDAGVPSSAVFAAAFGAEQAVASNADAAGRARNRRVEMAPMPRPARTTAETNTADGAATR